MKLTHSIAKAAFSLIEIMVTVALLTFIVLGLLVMFNQTQRVFRTSMTQSDVLEAGRATMDMSLRGMQEMTPSETPYTTNFFAVLSPAFNPPLYQGLPGSTALRTNLVETFYYLSLSNQTWIGTGYAVVPLYPNAGVGTLYRYTAALDNFSRHTNIYGLNALSAGFITAVQSLMVNLPVTNVYRIAEGVVHLRVRAFATNGFPIVSDGRTTNAWFRTDATVSPPIFTRVANAATTWNPVYPDQPDSYFMSNAVPGSVELELGILEDKTLDRFKSLGAANAAVQRQFLSNHVAQVHLFRQRIPIRNVDLAAYQ